MSEEQKHLAEKHTGQPQKQKKGKKQSWQQEVYTELRLLALVLAATILIFHFLTQLVVVVGSSMYPTLHGGDLLLAWRLNYQPEQGDIVVLHKETEVIQETIVKRVIATGGQTVEIDYDTNTVYVDGVRIREDYLNQEELDSMEERGDTTHIDVPEHCVFVMGDNRNHSTDSRSSYALGVVNEEYIIGKALFIFFPFDHISWLAN